MKIIVSDMQSHCSMNLLVPGAHNVCIVMADGRGGGQGAYAPLLIVVALAKAVAIGARPLPMEPRFDVEAALMDPMPMISNSSCVLQPSLPK